MTREGDQNAKWLENFPDTKAITLEEAQGLLIDKEDTASLDGWLDKSVVDGWFNE